MADKPVQLVSGVLTEVEAKIASAGAGDAGKIVALDASGKIDSTMMPSGVGSDSKSMTASEAISAGDIVNVHDSSGAKVRKADATATGKNAVGFAPSAISNGASGTINFEGTISGLSGLTIGATYYLATTAGGITATPPSGSGNVVQKVGTAISATELSFEPGTIVVRA